VSKAIKSATSFAAGGQPALDRSITQRRRPSPQARLYELRGRHRRRRGGDQRTRRKSSRAQAAEPGLEAAARYASPDPSPSAASAPFSKIEAAISPANRSFAASAFADEVVGIIQTEPAVPRSTLLHGCIFGVPIGGAPGVDNRPGAASVGVALGEQGDDVAATLASGGLDPGDLDARRATERLLSAFTGHLLDRVGSSDGLVDIEDTSTRRRSPRATGTPAPIGFRAVVSWRIRRGSPGRGAAVPSTRRRSRSKACASPHRHLKATLKSMSLGEQRAAVSSWAGRAPGRRAVDGSAWGRPSRTETVRLSRRSSRCAGRCLRCGSTGRFSQDGLVHCRWPSQVANSIAHMVKAPISAVDRRGAAPGEVQVLAEECMTINPYLAPWIASVAAKAHGIDQTRRRNVWWPRPCRFGTNAV
jgi:hypothetical protein